MLSEMSSETPTSSGFAHKSQASGGTCVILADESTGSTVPENDWTWFEKNYGLAQVSP